MVQFCTSFLISKIELWVFLGVISVVDELDFEQTSQYELLIRATDSVSGVYAEVPVSEIYRVFQIPISWPS